MINKSVVRYGALVVVFFCTLSGIVRAQDISFYEIDRFEYFTQSTTNRPDTVAAMGHALGAWVLPTYADSVLSATLTSPKGQNYGALTDNNGELSLLSQSGGLIGLAASAPGGTYQFHVECENQGLKTLKLNLPNPANGIRPIRVANFSQLQMIDASQTINIQWDKVARTGAHDSLQFYMYDSSGNLLYSENHISLDQTNLTLDPGTLQPNTTNNAYLTHIHIFSVSGSKLPHWCTVERRTTRFHIVTENPAGVFKFSPVAIVANETNGTALMKVLRTQGSAGEVTVDYFSTDATAQANVNYLPVSGTLVFADGETNQTFAVPLLNNGTTNPPLTVHFSLTNATGGAGLAVSPHAVLTILDSQSAPGTNVNACMLNEVEFYYQTNADKPLQTALSDTSRFYALVEPKFPGAVTNASLKLPNGKIYPLSRSLGNYQGFFEYAVDFPSSASMISGVRTGKYGMVIDSLTQGSYTESLSLGAERSFSVPHLTNWVDAQTIDPGKSFTLKCEPFVGGTTNDFVRVSVRDSSGEYVIYGPSEFIPGALPGTTRSFTIPANTLEYGGKYLVDIVFAKMVSVSRNSRTGIRSGVGCTHTTSLYIHTVPPQ